jgi:AraC-like DNA-binding protein
MGYFDGIHWRSADHVPRCTAWIDREFPECMALNFAHGGRIRYGVDGEPLIVLPAPVAWWTFPGPRFTYGACEGESWDHYYVSFDGPRADRMLREGLIDPIRPCVMPIYQTERFRQGFAALLASLQERPAENPRAVCLLEDLFLQIGEQTVERMGRSHLEQQILALLPHLRRQPGASPNWQREANRLGVSEVHFRRVFRALTGLPPGQFRKRAALDLAARRLRTTHDPVKVIASECGYDDVHHFTRTFRARFGVPPATYRNEMQP